MKLLFTVVLKFGSGKIVNFFFFEAAQVKIFFVTRISGNKTIYFFDLT